VGGYLGNRIGRFRRWFPRAIVKRLDYFAGGGSKTPTFQRGVKVRINVQQALGGRVHLVFASGSAFSRSKGHETSTNGGIGRSRDRSAVLVDTITMNLRVRARGGGSRSVVEENFRPAPVLGKKGSGSSRRLAVTKDPVHGFSPGRLKAKVFVLYESASNAVQGRLTKLTGVVLEFIYEGRNPQFILSTLLTEWVSSDKAGSEGRRSGRRTPSQGSSAP